MKKLGEISLAALSFLEADRFARLDLLVPLRDCKLAMVSHPM